MSRYSYQRLEPISEEITPADHQVFCLGGTSSNLERLPSRLQRAKRSSPDSKARMEESAYEISYLRAELHWHKETKQILLQLQENMYEIVNSLDDALSRATARLHESEKQYVELWQTNSGDDALSRATARLHESEKQYVELWQTNSGDGDGGYF